MAINNTITITNGPIDVSKVNQAVREHENLLVTIQQEEANDILQHFTPMPGVKDSVTLGKTLLGQISRKYTGEFKGQVQQGEIQPEELKVYPCVMEIAEEPENLRRIYVTEVAGGLKPEEHPFGVWLINWGVKSASKELHDVFLSAKYDSSASKTSLSDAFDGPLTKIQQAITAKKVSAANGNLYTTGALSSSNIGDKLLEAWRSMPSAARKQNMKLMLSMEAGDKYDDWMEAQGTYIIGSGKDEYGVKYLRGTGGKVEIVRMSGVPATQIDFFWFTIKENQRYGYDQPSDMNRLIAFNSGNPYLFTAAGKYVIGTAFVSYNKYLFLCNEQGMNIPSA